MSCMVNFEIKFSKRDFCMELGRAFEGLAVSCVKRGAAGAAVVGGGLAVSNEGLLSSREDASEPSSCLLSPDRARIEPGQSTP